MSSDMLDDDSRAQIVRSLIAEAEQEADALSASRRACVPWADSVPGYEIRDELGRGGMGVVYRALQRTTNRIVALKVMLAGAFASRSARERFEREVQLASRLQHQGIARVFESDVTSSGQPYYAMDYVDAVPLDRWLTVEQPDTRRIVALFVEIGRAIAHAHEHGVVHRDLKPSNVLVDRGAQPHIVDFGLAKAIDSAEFSSPGQIVGTLRYLPPEQASGGPVEADPRNDIYSLGVMLFEALTGAMPYDVGGPPSQVLQRIITAPPARPSRLSARVDRELETILLKALEKDPERRYPSALEFGSELQRWLDGDPILARRGSAIYHLRKKLARHRRSVLKVGAVLVFAAAGTWPFLWWRAQVRLANGREEALRIALRLDAGQPEEPLSDANALVHLVPALPEARLVLAQARFKMAQKSGNATWIDAALNALDDPQADRLPREACAALAGEIHRRKGDSSAEPDVGITEPPAEASAEVWYVRSFATLDLARARHYAEQALRRDDSFMPARARLAHLHYVCRDYAAAVDASEQLIARGGDPADWMALAGAALLRAGEYRRAAEHYATALAHSRGTAPRDKVGMLLRLKAVAELCLLEYQRACESLTEAFTTVPNVWHLYMRATPLWITGQRGHAADDYRSFHGTRGLVSLADARLFLVREDQARALAQRGAALEAATEHEEALRDLVTAQQADVPGELARILACFAGAIEPAALLADVERGNPKQVCECSYYAGEAYLLRGLTAEARNCFQASVDTGLALDPDTYPPDPMNEYHLARWRLDSLP